jgi:hypothetical protein
VVEFSFSTKLFAPLQTRRSTLMKHLVALCGIVLALLGATPGALAQSLPPPLPPLTAQQSADVRQRVDAYRNETEARVARGEISADEADRLVKWREWQIAQQVAARAPSPPRAASDVPPDYRAPQASGHVVAEPAPYYVSPPDVVVVEPAPYYVPYYPAPYYWGPRAYWGPAICAGGFGRHFGGRICF